MEPALEDVSLSHAKQHLEDLIERARRGEDVRISDDKLGVVKLMPVTERLPPPVKRRRLGHLEGKMTVPARLMEPMTDEELKDWYGDDQ